MYLARTRIRGRLSIAAIVALLVLVPAIPESNEAREFSMDGTRRLSGGWRFTRAERCFMRKINRARARHGRSWLAADKQLGYVGRRHARSMARNWGIWHDNVAHKVTRWRSIGQNVGRGRGCRSLFKAFMRSSGHRANIFGRWRYLGVGIRWRGGSIFTHMVFESRRNPGNIWHFP